MVYLLHFDRPIGNPNNPHGSAQHYIGFSTIGDRRIERHEKGDGSALTRACKAVGIGVNLVRTWPDGDRDLEKKLKRSKNAKRYCPVCKWQAVFQKTEKGPQ